AEPHHRVLYELSVVHRRRRGRVHVCTHAASDLCLQGLVDCLCAAVRRPVHDLPERRSQRMGPHLLVHGGTVRCSVALDVCVLWLVLARGLRRRAADPWAYYGACPRARGPRRTRAGGVISASYVEDPVV